MPRYYKMILLTNLIPEGLSLLLTKSTV